MGEKLTIKNFGPIKEAEFDFKRINVLIGEQATGKSTVAKVLAVCRYLPYLIGEGDPLDWPFDNGLRAWGLAEAIKINSYIFYTCTHYSVATEIVTHSLPSPYLEQVQDYLFVYAHLTPLSKEFSDLLVELNKIRPIEREGFPNHPWKVPTSFLRNEVARILDNPFYLPVERGLQSIFSVGKNSIQNLSDSLFDQLASIDQIARLFTKDTIIEPLNITYKNVDGKGFVKKNTDDIFYSLYNAASGYQSTIPTVLLVKYYNEIRKNSKTFIIEEPELNLFPSAQQKLMEFLVDKTMNYGNSMLINTHSPYILSAINNLLYAYKVGLTHSAAVNEIIAKKYWLNPSECSAYRLLPDGTSKNIMDAELDEIMVEELDGAGKEINTVYDKILDIKFRNSEKSGRISQLQ